MLSKAFIKAIETDLPVLFAYIGWANEYNGTERVIGNFKYLKKHPRDNSESRAFVKGDDHLFHCGVGQGQAPTPTHIVFVALEPRTQTKKVVGVYARAIVDIDETWADTRTPYAVLIPVDRRPKLSVSWPGKQGIRRWARREGGHSHPTLLKAFELLKSDLPAIIKKNLQRGDLLDQTYSGMEAREGKRRELLVIHRSREAKLRQAKIQQALSSNDDRLVCEVPGCGFDFYARYGELGYGYAHVHHLTPLAGVGKKTTKTTLTDLAIICANCHAMIHRHGECRNLKCLIPRKPRTSA